MDWRSEAEKIFKKHGYSDIRPFMTIHSGASQSPQAVSILVHETKDKIVVKRIRPDLPTGLIAFAGAKHWSDNVEESKIEIVIAPGANQFDILRLAQTSAPNYNLDTEDIIRHLQALDEKYGINILNAEADNLILYFGRGLSAAEIKTFMQDFDRLCPDVVGYYGEEDLTELLEGDNPINCWWD